MQAAHAASPKLRSKVADPTSGIDLCRRQQLHCTIPARAALRSGAAPGVRTDSGPALEHAAVLRAVNDTAHAATFSARMHVQDQLTGKALLPWEAGRMSAATRRQLGIFRKPVLALLQRDPALRASVQDFCDACFALVSSNTTS